MATILDGKELAKKIYVSLAEDVKKMQKKPCLAVILVGENPASKVYVANKEKSCEKVGVISKSIHLSETTSEEEILNIITELNTDENVSGMIVQLPLPSHMDSEKILHAIDPKKDADGFHPKNLGEVFLSKNNEFLPPATPAGIVKMLEEYSIDVAGKNVVVLGRSNIVGKPVATMLLNRNATVTVCHSKTKNLEEHTQKADIIIAAVGIPKFLKAEMVKDGVVVVDVGIHKQKDGKLCGDVDFENIEKKCSFISPVPGGVGPMTVASLIANTVRTMQK